MAADLKVVVQRVVLVVALLCLLALTWNGVGGGLGQLRQTTTAGQTIQSALQIGYGVLSLVSVGTVFLGRRWNRLALSCWAVCISLAAGFASVAWGDTSLATGLAAGAAVLLVARAIAWMVRFGARGLS
jgi:hypothetical protein